MFILITAFDVSQWILSVLFPGARCNDDVNVMQNDVEMMIIRDKAFWIIIAVITIISFIAIIIVVTDDNERIVTVIS